MQAISSLYRNLSQQVSSLVGLLVLLLGKPPVLRVSVPVSASLMPASIQIRSMRIMEEATRGCF